MSWLKLLAPQKLLIAVVEWRIFAAAFFGLPIFRNITYTPTKQLRPLLANWVLVLWPGNEVGVADITAKRRRCKLHSGIGSLELGFRLNLANVCFLIFDSHQRRFCSRFRIPFGVCCMQISDTIQDIS